MLSRLSFHLILLVVAASAPLASSTPTRPQLGRASNVIRRALEPLDPAGKYLLEYEVNLETKMATFLVVVETKGYVGFGISPTGGMAGADIVIGGVYDNGASYFSDRHGVGNSEPVLDVKQDYELSMVYENTTHTVLQFSRLFDTCDSQDVAITADTLKIIWSYGETDVIQYHGGARGTISFNLLDPIMPPFDESGLDKWTLTANTTMPTQATSYWCTMHKSPAAYNSKRHAIAFDTHLPTNDSLKHTHHLTMYRCRAPEGMDPDTLFGPLVGLDGEECFAPASEMPTDLCRDIIYVWAVGGKVMTLPEDVGYPINADGRPEYMMLEIHYDNPELRDGVKFESSVEIYNSQELREQEAALAVIAHSISFSHVLPGKTPSYTTVGHCSSQCTQDVVRPEGINVFNVLLHAHVTGRQLRLRHFRGRTELPWIMDDVNYNFDFQQNRPLREHARILPGDHLMTECVQNSMARDNVTIAGFGTTEEMCQSLLWYYPAGDLRFCESAYNEALTMEEFGIEDLAWDNIMLPPVVLAPESMANKTYLEVLDTMVDWTPEYVAELEQKTRYTGHYQVSCGPDPFRNSMRKEFSSWKKAQKVAVAGGGRVRAGYDVGYPDLDSEYQPENPCA